MAVAVAAEHLLDCLAALGDGGGVSGQMVAVVPAVQEQESNQGFQ